MSCEDVMAVVEDTLRRETPCTGSISPDAELERDLGLDSLQRIDVSMRAAKACNLSGMIFDLRSLVTVADIVAAIQSAKTCGTGSLQLSLLSVIFIVLIMLKGITWAETKHTVMMFDAPPYFEPVKLEISVGDTVVWTNCGPKMTHSIVDEHLLLFSDDINLDKNWSYTFTKAGEFQYLCARHSYMRGTVLVRNPDGSTTSQLDFPYQVAFREYVVPTFKAGPRMIIPSPLDDTIWFTEGGGGFHGFEDMPPKNKIGHLFRDGRIVEYATPTLAKSPEAIGVDSLVADKDGNIWFTERLSSSIGRLDRTGTIEEFPTPTPDSYPLGIDIDRQGNLWFAERTGNRLATRRTDGTIEEFQLPDKDSEPRTIFVDSRARVWYTARTANEIGYFDPETQQFVRLAIPTEQARPTGIAETPDGSIYFVEMVGNKIGKVNGNQIVEYAIPTKFSAPFKIVSDSSGKLWFTEVFGNAIGRLDPENATIQEFKIPTPDSRPGGICVSRDGLIWFTEQLGNKVASLDPRQAVELLAKQSIPATSENTLQLPRPNAPANSAVAPHLDELAPSSLGIADIKTIELPVKNAGPGNGLVEDSTGRLWVNELHGGALAAFNRESGTWERFPLPASGGMPVGLAIDPQGAVWATLFRANKLVCLQPAEKTVSEYDIPTEAALPAGIAITADGLVWFTELRGNNLSCFNPQQKSFRAYPLPKPGSSPLMIAYDRRNYFWISCSEENGNYLARFDIRTKTFDTFPLPTEKASPTGVLIDDEYVWVAEGSAAKIARFDPKNYRWEEFVIPWPDAEPVNLVKAQDGRLWVTDGGGINGPGGNRLIVFDPQTHQFGAVPMQQPFAKPRGILWGTDGCLWFTQQQANKLTRISFDVK